VINNILCIAFTYHHAFTASCFLVGFILLLHEILDIQNIPSYCQWKCMESKGIGLHLTRDKYLIIGSCVLSFILRLLWFCLLFIWNLLLYFIIDLNINNLLRLFNFGSISVLTVLKWWPLYLHEHTMHDNKLLCEKLNLCDSLLMYNSLMRACTSFSLVSV
jgi:hypothetical protein